MKNISSIIFYGYCMVTKDIVDNENIDQIKSA